MLGDAQLLLDAEPVSSKLDTEVPGGGISSLSLWPLPCLFPAELPIPLALPTFLHISKPLRASNCHCSQRPLPLPIRSLNKHFPAATLNWLLPRLTWPPARNLNLNRSFQASSCDKTASRGRARGADTEQKGFCRRSGVEPHPPLPLQTAGACFPARPPGTPHVGRTQSAGVCVAGGSLDLQPPTPGCWHP